MDGVTLAVGLAILVGLAGILVPVLPGLVLVWGAVLVWALERQDTLGWFTLAVATVLGALGLLAKYLLPGRRLREAGIPWWTMATAAVFGVIGFFVVPVVGIVLGFILGIYLAEALRLGGLGPAWPATRTALAAVGWSILIELSAALLIACTWLGAVLLAAR